MNREQKILIFIPLIAVMIGVVFSFGGCTETFERNMKSASSNWNGLKREIIVYDSVGNELFRQTGKFDIDYDNGRILYDDDNNLRHQIYFKNGIVIVNELGD